VQSRRHAALVEMYITGVSSREAVVYAHILGCCMMSDGISVKVLRIVSYSVESTPSPLAKIDLSEKRCSEHYCTHGRNGHEQQLRSTQKR